MIYRGRKIIDTKHSIDRYIERYPNLSKNSILKESINSDYITTVDFGATKVFIENGSIYDYGIGIYFSVE